MLSYAFVVNGWITRMTDLEKASNYTGLMYYYGMIIKNVFFFVIPEAESRYSSHLLTAGKLNSKQQ